MFLSRNKKIMYTPSNLSFTIYKWGLRESKLYSYVFVMWNLFCRYLFISSSPSDASGGLCFVIVAFPSYLLKYFCVSLMR